MWGDADFGMVPERVSRRQRFASEHIKSCSGQMSALERGDECFIDDMLAPPDVDDMSIERQTGKNVGIQRVLGFFASRQGADDHAPTAGSRFSAQFPSPVTA